ncbi:MAG: hypothetical protein H6534_06480 [Chthonomonadaceae bacterium]|nr:hypothetical protein [Chthonomonadaceae bacterium]
MRARVEDPEDGRWMTVDPLWLVESAYSYALNSPASIADPSGAKSTSLIYVAMKPKGVYPSDCVVRVCSSYGYADDDRYIWDPFVVTHQFVCAVTPTGRTCAWGRGGSDEERQCRDDASEGFPIRCRTVSTSCRIAVAACPCIEKLRSAPPHSTLYPLAHATDRR